MSGLINYGEPLSDGGRGSGRANAKYQQANDEIMWVGCESRVLCLRDLNTSLDASNVPVTK